MSTTSKIERTVTGPATPAGVVGPARWEEAAAQLAVHAGPDTMGRIAAALVNWLTGAAERKRDHVDANGANVDIPQPGDEAHAAGLIAVARTHGW